MANSTARFIERKSGWNFLFESKKENPAFRWIYWKERNEVFSSNGWFLKGKQHGACKQLFDY